MVMLRLTEYFEGDAKSSYDFGMELVDWEIDMNTNLEIEKYSEVEAVYAIGFKIQVDGDGDGVLLFLVMNDQWLIYWY